MASPPHVASHAQLPQPPPGPALAGFETQEDAVLALLPEVRKIAARIHRRLPQHVVLDDLVQAGTLGLLDAAARFDPGRHMGFRQYARVRISGAIFDSLREQDWASRYMRTRQQKLEAARQELESQLKRAPSTEELADQLGLDLQSFYEFAAAVQDLQQADIPYEDEQDYVAVVETVADTREHLPDEELLHAEMRELVANEIQQLKPQAARVLHLYYFEEWTMAEIAQLAGVTESRISQIHHHALRQLGRRLGPAIGRELDENARPAHGRNRAQVWQVR